MICNKSNIFLVDQARFQRELMENLYNNVLHALMLFYIFLGDTSIHYTFPLWCFGFGRVD